MRCVAAVKRHGRAGRLGVERERPSPLIDAWREE
jgi:hypothetical protein